MVLRLLRGALRVQRGRLALVALSAAMGSGIAAALIAVALESRDRVAGELRRFGANITVEPAVSSGPAGAPRPVPFLDEASLPRVLAIFWRHNVVGLAPSLTAPVTVGGPGGAERALLAGVWFDRGLTRPAGEGALRAGVVPLFPYWTVAGRWARDGARDEAVAGRALAARLGVAPGGELRVTADRGATRVLRVTGVVATGGFEEEEVLVPLEAAQDLLDAPARVSRALVSAVTVPLDDFGRRDPATMTALEAEKWFCTPYVTNVARQIEEALPGTRARPVWTVAEAEARVIRRLDALMALLAAVALGAATLAVASTFAARVLARRGEIALMRACGASAADVTLLLGGEVLALGLAGGAAGAGLAAGLVHVLGVAVFGTPLPLRPHLVLLALGGAALVAAAGAVWPIRRALALDPASALKAT